MVNMFHSNPMSISSNQEKKEKTGKKEQVMDFESLHMYVFFVAKTCDIHLATYTL